MSSIYQIKAFVRNCFVGLFIALAIVQCAQKKETDRTEEDTEQLIEAGKKLGNEIYTLLLTQDSLKISNCFDTSLSKDIPGFIEMLVARDEEWGEFHAFTVSDVTVETVYLSKGDTITYQVKVNSVYDYNESWDDFTLQKVNKGKFKVVAYDFDPELMLNCGTNELELLKPDYMDYSWAIFEKDTNVIWELSKQDKKFYKEIIALQEEFFPGGSTCDSIVYNTGYMRKYCGLKGEANGMLIYTVYFNDTTYLDLIYKIEKAADEEEHNMYSLIFTGDLVVDNEADVDFLKSISKEVYKIIQKNDVEGFISTFHSELRSLYTQQTLKELDGIVEDFKAMGKFEGYYEYHTFRTKDDDFTYYIVILDLMDEDGFHSYLEMVFKPDINKKFMLLTINEMLD
jgi:hypothetical protein